MKWLIVLAALLLPSVAFAQAWTGEISGTAGVNPNNSAAPNRVGPPGSTKAFYVWDDATTDSDWIEVAGVQGVTVCMMADLDVAFGSQSTTVTAQILWSGSDQPTDKNGIVLEDTTLTGANPNDCMYEVPAGRIRVEVGGVDDSKVHAIHVRSNE